MKLAFLGTPEAAVPPLDALVAAGHDVRVVVTRPDTRRGRGGRTSPSPVSAAATAHGIAVVHEVEPLVELARSGDVELGIVVAYGRLIRPHVLDVLLMLNLHFSLLPRWRGAAPVERAILAGDEVTGVCLMQLEAGLDTGPVHDRVEVPVGEATADELRDELVRVGADLLVDRLRRGLGTPEPQRGTPTHAEKLTSADLRIDWGRSPVEIHRQVRVGGAWTTFRGRRVRIVAADLVDGELVIREVRPEGKPTMSFDAWRNGVRAGPGEWYE